MSKLIRLIQAKTTSCSESIRKGYSSLNYGCVIKMLTEIQDIALEREVELNVYKEALSLIVNHSNAESIIKNYCQDILNRFS